MTDAIAKRDPMSDTLKLAQQQVRLHAAQIIEPTETCGCVSCQIAAALIDLHERMGRQDAIVRAHAGHEVTLEKYLASASADLTAAQERIRLLREALASAEQRFRTIGMGTCEWEQMTRGNMSATCDIALMGEDQCRRARAESKEKPSE